MKHILFILILCAAVMCGTAASAAKRTFMREYTYQGGEAQHRIVLWVVVVQSRNE